MQSEGKFSLRLENFSEVTSQIRQKLEQKKIDKKEILRTNLLLEETFMRMNENGGVEEVSVEIQKSFGDLFLRIESFGAEYNPLIAVTDFDENDEDYFRTLILKANSSKMNYNYREGRNIITISVSKSSRQIFYVLLGMALGTIFGLVLKEILPVETIQAIDTDIIKYFKTMFMNALNMIIAPVIFFSVISGITSITNAADVGRIGGKLIGFYTLTTLVASLLSMILGFMMFSGDVPQIETIDLAANSEQAQSFSILAMIAGVIPRNIIDPIVKNEMLQIIFMAVVFGIAINKLGDEVKILKEIIVAMNRFCLQMITMIVWFVPIVAFFRWRH